MALVATHEATEVLQPREEAFNLPAVAVAAKLPAVLRDVPSGRAMGRDELNATLGHPGVEGVAVVAAVADQARRQPPQEPALQYVVNESNLTRGRTCDTNGERKTSTVCDCHDLGAFPLAGEPDGEAPFFAPAKVASMNASLKSYPPAAASSWARWRRIRYIVPDRAQSWNRR